MSVFDIEEEMREIYEIEFSTSAISIITNKVNQAAQEWQNRPLDPVYLIVWMDGVAFKVRGQRQDHQQDHLYLHRSEAERSEGSPGNVGRQIGKLFFLDRVRTSTGNDGPGTFRRLRTADGASDENRRRKSDTGIPAGTHDGNGTGTRRDGNTGRIER